MISFIVAMDRNNGIGYQNEMPWYLPNDFKFFKEKTTGHTIIMGRKTFESIGRVLPNRKHIVLTTKKGKEFPDEVEVQHDLDELIQKYKSSKEEVFIIGGGNVFKEYIKEADRLYVTKIDEEFKTDVFFPEIQLSEWRETSIQKGLKDEKNPYDYYFIQYDRVS